MPGVSRATVSRVVNGSPKVSARVRERVEATIRALGYTPNLAARTLVTQRTEAIAVVVGEPATRLFADPFIGGIVRSAAHGLSAKDLQMVLLMVHDSRDHERIERFLAGGHVDGAIMFSLHRDDPLPGVVRRLALPTVFGGRPWGEQGDALFVDTDNRGGAQAAVRHLVEAGRTRIATITGPPDQVAAIDRLDGYRDVVGADSDPGLIEPGDFTQAAGEAAMSSLLARQPDLDAVFAASDLMAAGALRVLRRAGRRVPDDVAVVGFDDHLEIAPWTEPPLTTMHQSIDELGETMVELLIASLHGEADPQPVILASRLVIRASA